MIPDVSNGEVLTSSLPIGSRVAITCDAGFYDPYNGDVRCTDVGTISHTNIACQGGCGFSAIRSLLANYSSHAEMIVMPK